MNSSPTTHAKPCTAGFYPRPAMQVCVKRATSPRGGTLASANSPGGGHFLSPGKVIQRATNGVRLIREVQSGLLRGLCILTANCTDRLMSGSGEEMALRPSPATFLFLEPAHNLAAHVGNPNEAAVVRPAASGRARRPNRRRSPAKSRPSPFPVVDYIAHLLVSSVSLGRTCETKRSSFHEVGKIVHECDC
jgi:hypothetical protein